ncbi:MAG: FAD-dependent oxidoreductase [Caldisericaceae bacterium]|nr:FAD-dependent oxidoreductase [Caldisericaceae bacterium]
MKADLLVVNASTSGVCAAIQAARMGLKVVVVEDSPWVGGMLTAAGVSAIDGNHKLPSGLWGEFRQKLYDYYGGAQAVETGWVSNTLFEPKVGQRILKDMLNNSGDVEIFHGYYPYQALTEGKRLNGVNFKNENGQTLTVEAAYTIDASEYGDVIALSGAKFYYGRESAEQTGEPGAPPKPDDLIQDATFVAILKDMGTDGNFTIDQPENYAPEEFLGCCKEWALGNEKDLVDARTMLEYGRLPNDKFMINWPKQGNDYFAHFPRLKRNERLKEMDRARQTTLRFVYFIQNHLGFKNLALCPDEFPTDDHLALIPYIRESRRLVGCKTLKLQNILKPYADPEALYQQSIAVGNYPLDHHHDKATRNAQEKYLPIPAFTVPFGSLVPFELEGLIAAEKSISVTHMVNGCSRLQPVVMQIGQAAGATAALAIKQNKPVRELNIRLLQQILLDAGMYLMPFTDMTKEHWAFKSMQRIALCGLLKGEGRAKDWANEFYIFPEKPVTLQEALKAIKVLKPDFVPPAEEFGALADDQALTRLEGVKLLWLSFGKPKPATKIFLNDVQHLAIDFLLANKLGKPWIDFKKERFYPKEPMTRSVFAYLMDNLFKPFDKPLFLKDS